MSVGVRIVGHTDGQRARRPERKSQSRRTGLGRACLGFRFRFRFGLGCRPGGREE